MLDPVSLKSLAIELAAALPPAPPPEVPGFPTIQQTPRARAIRRIAEIAGIRGWELAITRALDEHAATHVSELPDSAVFALRDRMEYFEDCAQSFSQTARCRVAPGAFTWVDCHRS